MKELSFLLSLKNNLSAPLGKAQQAVEGFAKKSKAAFKNIGVGAAGLWGVVQGVKGLLGPADRVQQALNELATRNIDSAVLDAIYQAAQRFSTQFGKSAADFIASGRQLSRCFPGWPITSCHARQWQLTRLPWRQNPALNRQHLTSVKWQTLIALP
ncbi:hypothetical protein ACFFW8_21935 [Erwinia tracheiphila]